MNFPKFTGPGTTATRKRFWDAALTAALSSRKKGGRNVTVSEYQNYGTIVNVQSTRGGGGGGECCNRDVEEVGVIQFAGNIYGGSASPCSLTAFHSWVRIPHADDYSAPDAKEFKLWIDADCQIHFDINQGLPTTEDCDGAPDWGEVILTTFTVVNGASPYITFGFQARGHAPSCPTYFTSTFADTNINVTTCDLSPILGSYFIDDEGDDGCGHTITIAAGILIF